MTSDFITSMRNNPNVREKDCGNNISCFNFSHKAFWDRIWDEQTVRARGFFVDNNTNEIICRGFNKFFDLKDDDELAFPISYAPKFNGYLGLVSVHNGELFFATKGSCDDGSAYVQELKELFFYGDTDITENIKEFLAAKHCTAAFEVCSSLDRHIVNYSGTLYEDTLVLIGLIENTVEGKLLGEEDMQEFCEIAEECKNGWGLGFHIDSELTLDTFKASMNYRSGYEGYVLKDAKGKLYKVKTPWFKDRKAIRKYIGMASKGQEVKIPRGSLPTIHNEDALDFILNTFVPAYYEKYGRVMPITLLDTIYEGIDGDCNDERNRKNFCSYTKSFFFNRERHD